MGELEISANLLLKQVKMLTQQHLMLSEALAFANERIAKLEKELQVHDSVSGRKTPIYEMKVLRFNQELG